MDDISFRQAVLAHKDRVFAYAARLLGDRDDARDVAQEALVRLWEHRMSVPGPGHARGWLLKTAHRLCVDRLRVRGAPLDEAEPAGIPEGGPSPEALAANRQLGDTLLEVLATLSPRDRSVLLLRDVEGLSYEACADVLEVPMGTLKAVVHRARERARLRLVASGVRP